MTDEQQPKPPRLVSLVAEVECNCGEVHEFDESDELANGWQLIAPCDCGLRVSVQFDEPILQYDTRWEQ
jgi:hypothetical protein